MSFLIYISQTGPNKDNLMTNSSAALKIILNNLHMLLHKTFKLVLLSYHIICIEKEIKINIRAYKQK